MKFATVALFSLSFFYSNSQHLKINYGIVYNGFEINNASEISKAEMIVVKNVQRRMKDAVESQEITLFTKSNFKFFLFTESNMSIGNSRKSNLGVSLLNLHSYIYGLDASTVLGYDTGGDYIIKYENKFVEWTITKDTKDILGFKCFKAIPKYLQSYESKELNSYPTEVWFAPSINKRGGPLKYSNLPGLVLEVKSQLVTISATSIKEIKEDKEVPRIDKQIITEMQAYKNAQAAGAAIRARMKR